MTEDLGGWLRGQRESRGWTRDDLARLLMQAGQARGDRSMPGVVSVSHNIYRWERGGDVPSERYRLRYCDVLGITPGQFGHRPPAGPGAGRMVTMPVAGPDLGCALQIAYDEGESVATGHGIGREVLMAAHEASDRAEEIGGPAIGEATFEQLRADLARLSLLSDSGEPLAVFLEMRRVRDRLYRLMDRRAWPGEQTGLYFLTGCMNGLMGVTAQRLGYPDAAEELLRAAWAYAIAIDHRPLLAQIRSQQSYVAYWHGRTRRSRELALSGLDYISAGPAAAELHLKHARAAARLGDTDTAVRAVSDAHHARSRDYTDDLTEIGGEFAISAATHHLFAGTALAISSGIAPQAAIELEHAASLYDTGPGPGEDHWFGGKALAGADLAAIRLRSGDLDGAAHALSWVFALPPSQRVAEITSMLTAVRTDLAAPVFRDSARARDLDEQIEDYASDTIVAGLSMTSSLPLS